MRARERATRAEHNKFRCRPKYIPDRKGNARILGLAHSNPPQPLLNKCEPRSLCALPRLRDVFGLFDNNIWPYLAPPPTNNIDSRAGAAAYSPDSKWRARAPGVRIFIYYAII